MFSEVKFLFDDEISRYLGSNSPLQNRIFHQNKLEKMESHLELELTLKRKKKIQGKP